MDEYIEREALLSKLSRMIDSCKKGQKVTGLTALFQVGDAIMDCPSADVASVVHAHWQPYEDTVQCSACGFGTFMDGYFFVHGECTHADDRSFRFNFCPNCGAKMDKEVEE